MSTYVKTTFELVDKYARILDNIDCNGTRGVYTYQGVLGCFLNEWLAQSPPEKDWDTQEEIYAALDESLRKNDPELPLRTCHCGCGVQYTP